MEWLQFVVALGTLPADRVEEVFARHGVEAVTFSDAGNTPVLEPAPGEAPLWRNTSITGLFAADVDIAKLRADLKQSLDLDDLPPHRVEKLEDRQWEREWLKDFRPMKFGGRLWVCPAEFSVDDEDAVVVQLDPGLAFGTGTHPTTALCLEWLDGQDLAGKHVLDYGCGSGILSIAALLLGAASVTALDIDPQAITATRENSRRNGVDNRLTTTLDAESTGGEFDVVVANILAGILARDASHISGQLAQGGRILLSGILHEQIDEVLGAYRHWIDFDAPSERDDWVRLTGRRLSTPA